MRSILLLSAAGLLSACAAPPQGEAANTASDGQVYTGSRIPHKGKNSAPAVKTVDGRAAADSMRGSIENQPQGR
jgi:hypothetical protein